MNKIWIILKSEFWRRVRSKWFIILTLLAPILLIAMITLPALVGILASEDDDGTVAVIDETGVLFSMLQEQESSFSFAATDAPVDSVQNEVRNGDYSGLLILPPEVRRGEGELTYYSAEGGGLSLRPRLGRMVNRAVEQQRLIDAEAPPSFLEIVNTDLPLRMVKLTDEGEEADSTMALAVIGYIMGFFIYVTVLIYGAIVMQGVIEEKNSRVVEVMVSSVRPFQLLMGKVLGIGAMGLVQMASWGILMFGISVFAGSIVAMFIDPAQFNLPADASTDAVMAAADIGIPVIPVSLVVWFVLFFLGGYLLFASLYAAIGSAVENPQEAQSLSVPLTLVVVVPILFIAYVIESPGSTLSVVLSMIPFFSPILMIARIAASEVPFWQVALSYLLLIGGFIGSIWVSSRIYRIGILMYGKKPSFKDLVRWFRYA
jgi:ABC-2 type transport system permease protein